MSATTAAEDLPAEPTTEPRKGGRRKLILLAVPVIIVLAGAGLWFSGVLPHLLGMDKPAAKEEAADAVPTYVDIPEVITNLGGGGRRPSFVKFRAKIELAHAADAAKVAAVMPRLLDIFQSYIREVRPEELRDAAGTYRLREELIARADIVLAPVHVSDVLFTELMVQ